MLRRLTVATLTFVCVMPIAATTDEAPTTVMQQQQQGNTLRGVVVDDTKQPLPGVTVALKT